VTCLGDWFARLARSFETVRQDCCLNSGCLPGSPDGSLEICALRFQTQDGFNRIQKNAATTQNSGGTYE
jgi:hypothetical protein